MDLAMASLMKSPAIDKRTIGFQFERMAEAFLAQKGLRLLARNLHFRGGEIDLVFEEVGPRGVTLVLVEVRMRQRGAWITPEESLVGVKNRRVLKAAQGFLLGYRGKANEVRLDLVAIEGDRIRHLKGFIEA